MAKLNSRMTLHRKTDATESEFGGDSGKFVNVRPVWAEIAGLTPRQVEIAKGYANACTMRVRVWKDRKIEAGMRLVYRGRTIDIGGADHDTDDNYSILYCTEVKGERCGN